MSPTTGTRSARCTHPTRSSKPRSSNIAGEAPYRSVLDLGTGTGRMLQLLTQRRRRSRRRHRQQPLDARRRPRQPRARRSAPRRPAPGRRVQPTVRPCRLRPGRHPPGAALPRRPGARRPRSGAAAVTGWPAADRRLRPALARVPPHRARSSPARVPNRHRHRLAGSSGARGRRRTPRSIHPTAETTNASRSVCGRPASRVPRVPSCRHRSTPTRGASDDDVQLRGLPTTHQRRAVRLVRTPSISSVPLDPLFVSVTYGAGGSDRQRSFDAIRTVADTGAVVAGHLTCVGQSIDDVESVLDRYARTRCAQRRRPARRSARRRRRRILAAPRRLPAHRRSGRRREGARHVRRRGLGLPRAPPAVAVDRTRHRRARRQGRRRGRPGDHPDVLRQRARSCATATASHVAASTSRSCPACSRSTRSQPSHDSPTGAERRSRAASPNDSPVLDDDRDAAHDVAADLAAEQIAELAAHGVEHVHLYTLNRAELVLAVCERLGVVNPVRT